MKSIQHMGFEEATPIQSETIPLAMKGGDVIGQAQTGTGKTVAFGVPMIEKIDTTRDQVQGLIVAPTRELAVQVAEELYKLGKEARIRVVSVYGGQEISRQIRALKRPPHIIVGTPGRLLDHINRRTVDFSTVETVVLDEADEMLNMGFIEDIEAILSKVPEEHQTLLFSATMPDPIRRIANRFMNEPELVKIKATHLTSDLIAQYFVKVQEREKFDAFTRLLDIQMPELAIVFGRTKRRVDELIEALAIRGYNADGIHGDLTQARRLQVLRKFKDGSIDILVATDVAARGLDISGVSHVYNFDIPQDPESYTHRIGRTGRAGKEGAAVTFVTPREMAYLEMVEKVTKKRMERIKTPTADDAIEGLRKVAKEKIVGIAKDEDTSMHLEMAKELLEEGVSAEEIVAACLKQIIREPEEKEVKISDERPLPFRRSSGYSRDEKRRGGYHGGGRRGDGKRDGRGRGDDRKRGDRSRGGDDRKRGGGYGDGRRRDDRKRGGEGQGRDGGRRYDDRNRGGEGRRKKSNSDAPKKNFD